MEDRKNILVMGGSFNPPTIAHLKLIQAALDALNADGGYLVPVSHAYLKRKMVRAGSGHLCIPTTTRLKIDDPRIEDPTQWGGENLLGFALMEARDILRKEERKYWLSEGKRVPWNAISDFHGEKYAFLSNFFEAEVSYGGLTYGSNEAAFQAQKCVTEEEKLPFTQARPSKSKGMGRRVKLRPDWEEVKVGIMEQIVRAKFDQHPELATRLLATGDRQLIEGNTWGDTFWGVDTRTGQGKNHLGVILMDIRGELRKKYS